MPVAYGYRDVLIRGYVDEVVIARHIRSYERDDFVYDPIHYLPLLERKSGALDQAAPLQGWALPEEFGTLRRLLESRMGRRGKREYVQVLRLLETFSQQEVAAAAKDALRLGAISFDAVKHLVLCRLEGRPPRLDLELYPYLPRVRSRLGARWAAYFDERGIAWQYEPVRFRGWTPDFRLVLNGGKAYAEVKPVSEFPMDVAQRVLGAGWTGDILILGLEPRHACRHRGDGWTPVDLAA